MKFASWSPVHGKPGTTSNTLALVLYLTMKYKMHNMISQTNFYMNNLEIPLIGSKPVENNYFDDTGIDSLVRSIKSAPLDKETFYNASVSLLNDKLNLLSGTTQCNQEIYEYDMEIVINNIFRSAEQFYDLVFIDTNSGNNNLARKVIEKADLVIVNLSQNKKIIDDYFRDYNFNSNNIFYIIGNYDRRSKNNIKNLRKNYKEMNSNNSAIIPYCTEFLDAFSDGSLIDFMKKNLEANKDDKNGYFIENLGIAANKIIKMSGWKES